MNVESVAIVNAPYCPHTLAAGYATAFVRELGARAVPLDLEFDFSIREPRLWRALRATFNPYAPSELPRVQFVLRPEFLVYSLFRRHYDRPPAGVFAHEVELLDHVEPHVARYARLASSLDCDAYLFGVSGSNLWFSLLLAQQLRVEAPAARIIFGGTAAQNEPLVPFLRSLGLVDDVVRAAHPVELRRAIGGVLDRAVSDTHWNNSAFESLPPPALRGWPMPEVPFADYAARPSGPTRQVPIAGSIGCPFRCAFCFDSITPRIVHRSPESVVREMRLQTESTGSNLFVFCDPTLNFSEPWLDELCRRMPCDLAAGAHVTFAHARVQEMTLPLLDRLASAGFVHLNYGLESFSSKTLERMNKGPAGALSPEDVIVHTLARGIAVSVNLFSEYDRADPEAYAQQLAGVARLAARIDREVPRRPASAQFVVSRLRMEPHSTLFTGWPAERLREFDIQWPERGVSDATRDALRPLLRIWDLDYDATRTHDQFRALDRLARDCSRGGDAWLATMSAFRPDARFGIAPDVTLLSDESSRFVARGNQVLLRLDESAAGVWQAITQGRPLEELERGGDDSIRGLLCALLEERCIHFAPSLSAAPTIGTVATGPAMAGTTPLPAGERA